MKNTELQLAIATAHRFLDEAALCERMKGVMGEYIEPGAQAAATKRASMDLTKALAKLRQSR